jgi:DNA-binding transcriptional ArsR family regulator
MTNTTRRQLAQAFLWGWACFNLGAFVSEEWQHAQFRAAVHLGLTAIALTLAWILERVDAWLDARIMKAQADCNLSVAAWEVIPDEAGARILAQLKTHGTMTPGALAKALKISRPNLRYRIKRLEQAGHVVSTGATAKRQVSLPRRAKEAP